jgi:oligoribonuclease
MQRCLALRRAITTRRVTRFSNAQQRALVWIDCEMTGLDAARHALLELACVVTDAELNVVAECTRVIAQPAAALALMDEWCRATHTTSGLLADIAGPAAVPLDVAETDVLQLLMRHTPRKQCPLAGASVHVDRAFLDRHMPRVAAHLHYRNVDVSSISELCQRWLPAVEADRPPPAAGARHRARPDIDSSINLLRFYRKNAFISLDNNRYFK